jgi:SAM-dependent methyltransferase
MSYNTAVKAASLGDVVDVVLNTKHPRVWQLVSKKNGLGRCYVCGNRDGFAFKPVLNDDLSNAWQLDKKLRKQFDIRESSSCNVCRSSLRSNLHARAICALSAPTASCLKEAVKLKEMRQLKIAEINACGALHQVLQELPNLAYSEYAPPDKTIRREDITALSYQTGSLDMVLTSETLEHVPDWQQGFREISRVLKKGGHHIFTVPAVLGRQTRYRVAVENGEVKELLPASFHGCTRNVDTSDYTVCTEFGADLRRRLEEFGFDTKLYYRNVWQLSDPNFVFVATKL